MKILYGILLFVLAPVVVLALACAITSMVNNVTFAETLGLWFDAVLGFLTSNK